MFTKVKHHTFKIRFLLIFEKVCCFIKNAMSSNNLILGHNYELSDDESFTSYISFRNRILRH